MKNPAFQLGFFSDPYSLGFPLIASKTIKTTLATDSAPITTNRATSTADFIWLHPQQWWGLNS